MMDRVGCLGLSHHDAPVAVREALCLSPEARNRLHRRATDLRGFAMLATCNRLEFYVDRAEGDSRTLREAVRALLPGDHGAYLSAARPYMYEYTDLQAARHLARVAAGLDSMVLGEPQIQGQVRESLRQSTALGCASPLLSAVFQAALRAGGRVREETAFARSPVSVASVAVDLVRRMLGPLQQQRVAILGAGQMGRLTAKLLHKEETAQLIVVNRTESRAQDLAQTVGAQARPLTALKTAVRESDVIFCTAGGEGVLLDAQCFQDRPAPLLIMDLAVPRNVAADVQRIPGVQLHDIDSLRDEVDASMTLRRAEVPKAAAIVDEEMAALKGRMQALAVEPIIRSLRLKAEGIREQELARTLKGMNDLHDEDVARLRRFSQVLVNRILHEPTTRLRECASNGGAGLETDLIRTLFAL